MDHLVELLAAASFGLAPKREKTLLTAANRVSVWAMTFLLGVGLAGFSQTSAAQVTVSTLAGAARIAGSADGSGAAARFSSPSGIAADTAGNLYVTDQSNHTIRKITAAGVVSTLAGTPGVIGSADGSGAAAQFAYPHGIAVDTAGNLYVVDMNNHTIRKITAAGVVSTLAGTAGVFGKADGTGAAARFFSPRGIAIDTAGNLYVTSYFSTIRKITVAGVVSTVAGTAQGFGSADGSGAAAQFSNPHGIAADAAGNLYVADTGNSTIRKITAAGVVSTLAGTAGVLGNADGSGAAAQFYIPIDVTTDTAGNLYVADRNNSTIRKITAAGVVSTLAGTAGALGGADGTGAAAQFGFPSGIVADTAGNLYVADTGNHTIRKITQSSVPIIANLSPNSGPVGAPLFIQGSSFGAQQNISTVSVCGVSPAVTKWSSNLIAVAVPNFPAGTVCDVRVSTSQGASAPAQYTITRLTSVSGRVVNQIGDPLGSVTVLLSGPTSKTITTTANGQYLFSGIPSGDYTARLFRTGYRFTPSPKTVSVNGVVDVTSVVFYS